MDSSNKSFRPVIELEGVHLFFKRIRALDIETLKIEKEERVFVLGRSGSGKTTLVRLIKGRLNPSAGRITTLGKNPFHPHSSPKFPITRRIAMIDQEFHLIPRLSVVENVLSGCLGRVTPWKSIFGWYPEPELEKAEAILHEVDLDRHTNQRVETLSGGQRQRTAIARALMQEADIILADEPVSNLDPELTEDALDLLIGCASRRGATLVVNLHQPFLARTFASRIIGLSKGRILYDGPPEKFDERAAAFLFQAERKPGKVIPLHEAG